MLTIFAIIGIIICLPIILWLVGAAFVALCGLALVAAAAFGIYVGADYVSHKNDKPAAIHATNVSHKR